MHSCAISKFALKRLEPSPMGKSENIGSFSSNLPFKKPSFTRIELRNSKGMASIQFDWLRPSRRFQHHPLPKRSRHCSLAKAIVQRAKQCLNRTFLSVRHAEQSSDHSSSSSSHCSIVSTISGSSSSTLYRYSPGTSSVKNTVVPAR